MMESYARNKKRQRKQKINDDFILAEVIANNIVSLFFPDKQSRTLKPWDYYEKMFTEEKEIFEKHDQERKFKEYQARRKDYFDEINRRRKQGL